MGSCSLLLLSSLLLVISTLLLLSRPARSDSAPSNVSHHDQQALLGLKRAVTSDPNNSLANWTPSLPFCNWIGITCSFHLQRVLKLNISNMGLVGTVSSLVGNLSALESLDMSNNFIYGHIPPQLGQLTNAKELIFYKNDLEGIIPANLSSCHSLVELVLSENRLQGNIPVELGHLPRLEGLYLGENTLTGIIPSSLGNLSALIDLAPEKNDLTGLIPIELGKLTNLQLLFLWGNQLSGTIPSSIGNLSFLIGLELSYNNLIGPIPAELGKLTQLQDISIYANKLSGPIPAKLGKLTNLQFLYLWGNQFSGKIPNSIGNCSKLEELILDHNMLSGTVPMELGHLSSKLSHLILAHNKIGGSIPKEIGNLINLIALRFSDNLLRGHIPSEIGRLHKLERLDLSNNNLYGTIPDEIGEMQSLGLLNVSWNNLSGRIPNSLGRLQQLRRLFLHHNQFSGEIPASLKSIPNLELLDFSYNDLRGKIPGEVMTSLQNLQFYLNLSRNVLQGQLPIEISKIINAQAIDVSSNHLDGDSPEALGNCIALEYLNLSHNVFEGRTPKALGKLRNLQVVDLSYNFLSGQISSGLFLHSNVTALFMENPKLCGPKKYLLPECSKQGHGKHLLLTKAIPLGVGVIVFIICSLILGIMWNRRFSRKQFVLSNFMFQRLGYEKFTYQDLFIATNGFNEINLLGSGNFGSVYKGVLRDGKTIAIKVFSFENEEGQRSFKRECKVLGRVRHRNLIRVISACSYPDFKGLVLQFASNGSLEKHLHLDNNEEDVCGLGLSECLNIAIDVAHGMEHLHYDSPFQVVHCDLKPGNVLLDENMTALVTDFGLSRLTSSTNSMDSMSTTLTLQGSIGYIAPEYGLGERVSIKGDVYSYGVLLLEMVTRKRPTDAMFVEGLNLQKWVSSAFPNMLQDVVDSRFLSNVNTEQHRCLVSFIHIGLFCTNESPQERPTMRDVRRALESLRDTFIKSVATTSYLTRTISDLICNHNATIEVEGMSESQSSTY